MTNKDRNIKVMFFSGETGTFKTTYAKQFCINQKKSFCISSSSNDPLQDYMGEDVLILDDLRDDDYKFQDLIKLLDNHTLSTSRSRYSNKAFIGDTIIITTNIPLSEWYFDIQKEDKNTLYRRITEQYQFTKDYVSIYGWNDNLKKYTPLGRVPNVQTFKPSEIKPKIIETIKAMGIELSQEVLEELIDADFSKFDQYTIGDYVEKPSLVNEVKSKNIEDEDLPFD